MPRPLMFQEHPWQSFELTIRCHQSRLLMCPGDECSRRVVGVLGRALELYGDHVHLYFAGGTSNHLHIIAAFEDAEWKARFKSHIKTNISKELGELFDWPGNHWDRRTRDIPILDDEALEDRLAYLAVHGVKENLVSCPGSWPGIQWVRAGTPISKAVNYAINQSDALRRFLGDGRLPLHNNISEGHLRRQAVGRKNWLFLGSDDGGHTNARLTSLLASCQMHGVEPLGYLRDLFCLLPRWTRRRVLELAPVNWKETLQQEETQQRLAANVFRRVALGEGGVHGGEA